VDFFTVENWLCWDCSLYQPQICKKCVGSLGPLGSSRHSRRHLIRLGSPTP